MGKHNRIRINDILYALLVLLCVAIVLLVAGAVAWQDMQQSDRRFQQFGHDYARQLLQKVERSEVVVEGLVALSQITGVKKHRYLSRYAREMSRLHPYIHMIQFYERVGRRELKPYERKKRASGLSGFSVHELNAELKSQPVGKRSFYFPLVLVQPDGPFFTKYLGYDIYSNPLARKAILRVINTGRSAASAPDKLIGGGYGSTIFKPVYSSRVETNTEQERLAKTVGIAAAQIRFDKQFFPDNSLPGLTVRLTYESTPVSNKTGPGKEVYHHSTPADDSTVSWFPRFSFSSTIPLSGEELKLSLSRQAGWQDFRLGMITMIVALITLFFWLFLRLIKRPLDWYGSEQYQHEVLFREKERAEVTLHSIGDGVITTDLDGNVDYLNQVAEQMTGWSDKEAHGRPLKEVFNVVNENTRESELGNLDRVLADGEVVKVTSSPILMQRRGEEYVIENTMAPIRQHGGQVIGAVIVFHDVSHVRSMARQLAYQATHDPLTGLVNRREFERQLEHALHSAKHHDRHHALCFLDLDQFKVVNDTCGHIAGDKLLKQLAILMEPKVSNDGILARLGGDEFGVLLFNCPLEHGVEIAQQIRQVVRGYRFVWEDKIFEVGVSIGLVPFDAQSGGLQEIMRTADSACYIAKDQGRNRLHIYQPDDSALALRQGEMQWVHRISKAFDERRFYLARQSVLPLNPGVNNRPHYEILLRMLSEDGRHILPSDFIPAAERYDMMRDIDRWVIKSSFELIQGQTRMACSNNRTPPLYNINLSGHSLNDEAYRFIIAQLEETGIDPGGICFEITETAAIDNLGYATSLIRRLKKLGCRFALDDFGSGLSSFGYLKTLPVDFLKIDGGFVRDITNDLISQAMVESIHHIGHVMGLQTIAEGVENETILTKVRELGIDYAQGYAISDPQPWGNVPMIDRASGQFQG